jgi:hypothetical protein
VAFFLVYQTFSDVLTILNTKQTISQSNENNLGHYDCMGPEESNIVNIVNIYRKGLSNGSNMI